MAGVAVSLISKETVNGVDFQEAGAARLLP